MDKKGDPICPGGAAALLCVHPQRLTLWDRQGKLKPIRLPSGPRRYHRADLPALADTTDPTESREAVGLYARVSTGKQADAGSLERQRERLMECAARHGLSGGFGSPRYRIGAEPA